MNKTAVTATTIGVATAALTMGTAAVMLKNSPKSKKRALKKAAKKSMNQAITAFNGMVDGVTSAMMK